jgi:signal transduction histidine kinase
MHTFWKSSIVGLAFIAMTPAVFAANKGTADEAVAMVKKAKAFLEKEGEEKALKEFNNSSGKFRDRDLYIFVIDQKATMLAHGTLPKIVNKNVSDMKDADGKYLFKDMLKATSTEKSAWVRYKWPNPTTGSVDNKATYLERAGDLVIGCGVYE